MRYDGRAPGAGQIPGRVVVVAAALVFIALLSTLAWTSRTPSTASPLATGWAPLVVVPATVPAGPPLTIDSLDDFGSSRVPGVTPSDFGGWPAEVQPRVPALIDRSVLVVGDSLVKAARAEIAADLYAAGASLVRVAAQNGATIVWAADRIPEQGQHDVVIVAAGTNDATGGWSDAVDANVRRALAAAIGARCTIWILPTSWRHPEFGGARTTYVEAAAAQVTVHLRDVVTDAGWSTAEWDDIAAFAPELHAGDGIHHTAAGRSAYAAFMLDAAQTRCLTF